VQHTLLSFLTLLLASLTAVHAADLPALQSPQHFGVPSAEHAVTNRAFTGIPSIAVAPRGRIWAVWYAGVTPSEDANNYVVLATSGDNGTTWSEVLTVDPDGSGPVRSFDPELWVSPDGRLFLFWAQRRNAVKPEVWCVETTQPDVGQPAWSRPRRISEGVMMCKPVVLSSGEWGLPISQWGSNGWSVGDNSAQLVVSSDAGKTWSLRGSCNVPEDAREADEHMVVERTDRSLWMLVRTRYGIGESVSTDRGKTWPELKPSAIQHPTSRFFLRRLFSGNLLLVKHGPIDTRTGRSHLTAYLSKDDGKNWSGGLMLDERNGVSYPDGDQSPDGLISIIYDYNRTTDRNILMASFREEDVVAGRDASGMVRLRQLVSHGTGGQQKPRASATPQSAEFISNSIGMKLARIRAGTFTMGQDGLQTDYKMNKHPGESDRADWDEKPVHRVVISKPFYIGSTEVTVEQYRRFDPAYRTGNGLPDEAASGISWNKAVEFCAWLSKKEGKPYRLPTEAEWEYACRAGTTTVFNTGDKLPDGFLPWFIGHGYSGLFNWSFYFPDNKGSQEYLPIGGQGPGLRLASDGFVIPDESAASVKKKQPLLRVAQRAPNAWGLYDMHGNLCEWCSDWYGPYVAGEQTDPRGRSAGDFRVFRDGPHSMLSRLVRSANRGAWIPESSASIFGFRVVIGDVPQGALLPPEPPPKNARDVKQGVARIVMPPQDEPFFRGPKPFVKIPEGSCGPLFSSHNHSPGITECPNGDLLATWFSTVLEGATELCNAAARLRFGESEWEEASPFWDGADINDHAPKLWWDGDSTIYHIARGHSENIVRTSTDNGATWSVAKPIYPQGETGNGMIRTRKGALMLTQDVGVSLYTSSDNGGNWSSTGSHHPNDQIRPGGKGGRHAGIHAPVVELADGRLMTIGRPHPTPQVAVFGGKAPLSFSSDEGHSWTYVESEFPAVTSVQRPVMIRLREGPILLCSFTDQWSEFYKGNRKGMTFKSKEGQFTGYGLFAALSYDEGKTWPDRRLITPGGPKREAATMNHGVFTLSATMAEPKGYLSITQTRDARLQLITSGNHYVFNLAWIKQLPSAPNQD
jgi:formylglycine-generating enzyme required for sulfatase activity